MGDITFETVAYAKLVLHAVKYPHCAVNGILLADATKIGDGSKKQDLVIVDAIPLFHHSHYVSPMAEIALTQIDAAAQASNRVIAGYYAACENYYDNTVEKCPGQKIAEKIVEHFPAAVFVVINNTSVVASATDLPINLYRYSDGKWKLKDLNDELPFNTTYTLTTVWDLIETDIASKLVDFDNYLDDQSQDWTNLSIDKLIAGINAADQMD